MERSSGKRGTIAPKKGYNVGLKNTHTETDQTAQFCNRIGCSGRIKYAQNQNTKIGSSGKAKLPKTSFSSSSGIEEMTSKAKRSFPDSKRKTQSQLESDLPESSQSAKSEGRELLSSPSHNFTRHCFGSKNKTEEAKILSSSNIHSRKVLHHKFVPSNSKRALNNNNNNNSSSSSNSSCSSGGGDDRYCKLKLFSGKNVIKKKNPEIESSSSLRERQKSPASAISISSSGFSNFASGDSKSAGSVRMRRPVNANNGRPRLSVGEPQFSLGGYSSYSLSSGNHDGRSTMRPSNVVEVDFAHLMNIYNTGGITEVLLALDGIQQDGELTHEPNINASICNNQSLHAKGAIYEHISRGICDFEREQQVVIALESNFYSSRLNLYDQHRDMRLDIDNMSYEELLALGERMGTVSTALSDEALSKCIKRSIYGADPTEVRVTEVEDVIKCSICQDEYVVGDETGELVECQHEYHLTCINQWLHLKNWCPVCKAAAAP